MALCLTKEIRPAAGGIFFENSKAYFKKSTSLGCILEVFSVQKHTPNYQNFTKIPFFRFKAKKTFFSKFSYQPLTHRTEIKNYNSCALN